MFSRLTSYFPWLITICALVVSFFYVAEQQFLESKVAVLQSDNARVVEQRNSVISINHTMYNTIQLMKQQLVDAEEATESMRQLKSSMDSKLSKAQADIKRLTDGKTQNVSCDDSFSGDVYQRMLDEYGTGDSRKE